VACDKLIRCVAITVLAPAFGEHVFLVSFEHRKPPDTFQIARTGFLSCRRQLSPVLERRGIGLNSTFCRRAINAHTGTSSTEAGINEKTDGSKSSDEPATLGQAA
jgi:hypothetical protein